MDYSQEQTFLRTAITEVLPDLPEMTKDILEESLQSLGVETSEDFQFKEEADLLSSLRPIQARKLLAAWKMRYESPETSSSSVDVTPRPYEHLPSPSTPSSSSSNSCQSPEVLFLHQPREGHQSGERHNQASSCEPQSPYLDSRTFRS